MPGSTERPGPRGTGRWSIARRLALFHGAAVMIGCLLSGALFYAELMPGGPGLALPAALACGLLLALGGAHAVVRLGARELEAIARAARGISQRELHARIDESGLPAELFSLAQSLNGMLARLEDSFDSLSHYSADLAHELRTPLHTLMLAADLALSRDRSPEEYRAVIGSSLEEFGRLSSTIDRMLFLARADCERQDVALERLDAAGEIETLLDYYSDSALEAGVSLESSGTATLYADQTLLRRALGNLIGNALGHTPRGGKISISVSQAPDLSADLLVSDTGCGIEARHLPRITDRFYRVEGSGVKNSGGTGLGLAIVRAIMRMHGGTIAIESAPGCGTRVTLHFPPPVSA